MTREFLNMVKEEVVIRVERLIGQVYDVEDIGFELTSYENCNGSWSCGTYEDMENIKQYFEDCADFTEYYESEIGDDLHINPFTEPEKFFCIVMIFAIDNVFRQCVTELELEGEIDINNDFLEKIKSVIIDNVETVF